jgi:hypothetical protein
MAEEFLDEKVAKSELGWSKRLGWFRDFKGYCPEQLVDDVRFYCKRSRPGFVCEYLENGSNVCSYTPTYKKKFEV